jgi:hypothetical protein
MGTYTFITSLKKTHCTSLHFSFLLPELLKFKAENFCMWIQIFGRKQLPPSSGLKVEVVYSSGTLVPKYTCHKITVSTPRPGNKDKPLNAV